MAASVFGHEAQHAIKYKTLTWPLVAILMLAEIVSNGMLALPSSLAAVGMVPGLVSIALLGALATYTSWLLVAFKHRHPEVHTMGDAGYILFGRLGRETMAFGTCCFAVFAAGGQLLAGQIALAALGEHRLCGVWYTAVFAGPALLCSLPRTLRRLGHMSVASVVSIFVAGVVGMAAAGVECVESDAGRRGRGRVEMAVAADFYTAFAAVTNPVFSFAGHFMFFVLVSEMKEPQHAMRAAYTLQFFATVFYLLFAGVTYGYVGSTVQSPSFSSLSPYWQKVCWGIALPNLLVAASLYAHTASKVVFVRIFRHSRHLHSHTLLGWGVWVSLVVLANGLAFVLAVGVPIFNYLIGIAASLFAAWFTYGVAGMFWLHDSYHDGPGFYAWRQKWGQASLAVATVLCGAFICVAGLYVTIRAISEAYANGQLPPAFTC